MNLPKQVQAQAEEVALFDQEIEKATQPQQPQDPGHPVGDAGHSGGAGAEAAQADRLGIGVDRPLEVPGPVVGRRQGQVDQRT